MLAYDLFDKVKSINPHQRPEEELQMWLDELNREVNEYIRNNYDLTGTPDERLITVRPDETLVDEPGLYISYLAFKVDYSNGEYNRANNHAALHNAAMVNWKERFFRDHEKYLITDPRYIRGLI